VADGSSKVIKVRISLASAELQLTSKLAMRVPSLTPGARPNVDLALDVDFATSPLVERRRLGKDFAFFFSTEILRR
jgi:hypothetical protein